jgi:hypothetical protein
MKYASNHVLASCGPKAAHTVVDQRAVGLVFLFTELSELRLPHGPLAASAGPRTAAAELLAGLDAESAARQVQQVNALLAWRETLR